MHICICAEHVETSTNQQGNEPTGTEHRYGSVTHTNAYTFAQVHTDTRWVCTVSTQICPQSPPTCDTCSHAHMVICKEIACAPAYRKPQTVKVKGHQVAGPPFNSVNPWGHNPWWPPSLHSVGRILEGEGRWRGMEVLECSTLSSPAHGSSFHLAVWRCCCLVPESACLLNPFSSASLWRLDKWPVGYRGQLTFPGDWRLLFSS